MKLFLTFLTTVLTTCALAFFFGMVCAAYDVPDFITSVGSFCIGFFGSNIIYKWLSKPDPELEEDSGFE